MRWPIKGAVYSLSATLVAAAVGALLGLGGGLLPVTVRLASASLLGAVAVVIGALGLSSHNPEVLQCDRETPQRWVHAGPLRWALRNGSALGVGWTSRIGFWLWYVIPAGAILFGQPVVGALLYGTYGLVRGWAVWIMLLRLPIRLPRDEVGLWLLQHHGVARLVTTAQLIVVGVAVVVAVGF